MGFIELTFCGDWTQLPELATRFHVSFLPPDPELLEDFRFVGGRAESVDVEDLARIEKHTGIIHAELKYDNEDPYAMAREALSLARTLFSEGASGLFVETATKVFTPRTIAEISTDEPRFLYHFLVEVFGNQRAIMSAGMCAFNLPDVRVPYKKSTLDVSQAAAFSLSARMICDRFVPTEGGVFRASESAPIYSTHKVRLPGHENPLGFWELRRR